MIVMIKTCFCALAMLVGAVIGFNAPAEWRGDASRLAHASFDVPALSLALADR